MVCIKPQTLIDWDDQRGMYVFAPADCLHATEVVNLYIEVISAIKPSSVGDDYYIFDASIPLEKPFSEYSLTELFPYVQSVFDENLGKIWTVKSYWIPEREDEF